MMTKEDIKRSTVTTMDFSEESELTTLAEEAKTLLGYPVLAALKEKVETTPLMKALAKLEISVLDAESVKLYKEERRDEVNKKAFAKLCAEIPDVHNHWYSPFGWTRTKIDEYKFPIPEFVLNKAVQIKKECPEAELYVESLMVDPFLVAVIPGATRYSSPKEEAYIEVWDEPKFEGRL